ncbi:hypothetical protein ACJJTC_015937 [Scirpophaga incertulas]
MSEKKTNERDKCVMTTKMDSGQYNFKGYSKEAPNMVQRNTGGGDLRIIPALKDTTKSQRLSPFRTVQGPVIKTVNDARTILKTNSFELKSRKQQLESKISVTPHCSRVNQNGPRNLPHSSNTTSSSYTAANNSTQFQFRRRLGRSPSPPQSKNVEYSRATNTQDSTDKLLTKKVSKSKLRDALSRLKGTC